MIPKHTKEAIDRYVEQGYPTGDFLRAVLTNNLYDAACYADNENRDALYDIVIYLFNYLPYCSFGTIEKVKAWLQAHKTNRRLTYENTTIDIDSAIEFDKKRRTEFYEREQDESDKNPKS